MSFNWFSLIPQVGHENAHIATAAATTAIIVGAGAYAKKALGKGDEAVLPADKFSVRAIFEVLTEIIQNLVDMVIGEHGRKYIPMFASIFTFVLISNLIGVIPGMTPATENINTTFALGLFVFIVYNYLGFKEVGFAYLKHFTGPVIWLAWFMFPLELISNVVRPFSLALRLANVLMGDHAVVGTFLNLVPIGVPIPFYLLGLIVCFVQALVFTLLSMVYVSMATAHDH